MLTWPLPSAFLSKLLVVFTISMLMFSFSACEIPRDSNASKQQKQKSQPTSAQTFSPSQLRLLNAVNAVSDRLHDQAIADGKQLTIAIGHFLENSTDQNLEQAKQTWSNAHASLTTLLAVYQADKSKEGLYDSSVPYSVYSLLDATPMLPGYLDAIPEYPVSGLINALKLPINIQTLVSKHQYADDNFVVFGLHPIEFFLWEKGGLLIQSQSVSESKDDKPVRSEKDQKSREQRAKPAVFVEQQKIVKNALRNEIILNQRRKTFLRIVSKAYENQLVALKKRWHQNELATAYLEKPKNPDQKKHPKLNALMLYVDNFITGQLMPAPDSDSYLFEQHFQFSGSKKSFWEPVFRGIEALMEISNLPKLPSEAAPKALRNCLMEITSTDNKIKTKPCHNETLALKEEIILSFAKASKK